MPIHSKLLVDEREAKSILSISDTDLEWLVTTQQLFPVYLRGRRLFEIAQLEELIRIYKTVQTRGPK
ncbi:MAG: hypothetical protein RB191_00690 [Terriglobia bacterium]|nr:hypothetical protein [Terriglobia bacterium]